MTTNDLGRIVLALCASWLVLLLACGETHEDSSAQSGASGDGAIAGAGSEGEGAGAGGEGAGAGDEGAAGAGSGGTGAGMSVATGASNVLPDSCELNFAFLDPPVGNPSNNGGDSGGVPSGDAPERVCGCTRRPSPRESFQCKKGVGQSVTQEVGPEGGRVSLSGTASTVGVSVELVIPPRALDRTVEIRITETSIPPPEAIADWSPLYHFEPEDLTFNAPVELKMPWSGTSSAPILPRDLAIYASDTPGSCTLAPLQDNYINAGFNQGTLPNFGWVIVGVSSESAMCDGVP